MDENLNNFWKNYENIMKWGHEMSRVLNDVSRESTLPLAEKKDRKTNTKSVKKVRDLEDKDRKTSTKSLVKKVRASEDVSSESTLLLAEKKDHKTNSKSVVKKVREPENVNSKSTVLLFDKKDCKTSTNSLVNKIKAPKVVSSESTSLLVEKKDRKTITKSLVKKIRASEDVSSKSTLLLAEKKDHKTNTKSVKKVSEPENKNCKSTVLLFDKKDRKTSTNSLVNKIKAPKVVSSESTSLLAEKKDRKTSTKSLVKKIRASEDVSSESTLLLAEKKDHKTYTKSVVKKVRDPENKDCKTSTNSLVKKIKAPKVVSSESTLPLIEIKSRNTNTNSVVEKHDYDSSDDSDIDLGYLEFNKKTLIHQQKIKDEKKKIDEDYGLCKSHSLKKDGFIKDPKKKSLKELYGSKADEIDSMERKLIFEYTRFHLENKPMIWPHLAFNLTIPDEDLELDLDQNAINVSASKIVISESTLTLAEKEDLNTSTKSVENFTALKDVSSKSSLPSSKRKGRKTNTNFDVKEQYDSVIDVGYLEFAKNTLLHQQKTKNEKKIFDEEYGFRVTRKSKKDPKKKSLKELYGSKADEIESIERKLVMEFTRFHLENKPIIWPHLAFNLTTPDEDLDLDQTVPNTKKNVQRGRLSWHQIHKFKFFSEK